MNSISDKTSATSPTSKSMFGEISDEDSETYSILDDRQKLPTPKSQQSPRSQKQQKRPQTAAAGNFSNILTKLQEEQVIYLQKLEAEKQRKETLSENIEQAKLQVRLLQDKTKNGNIVKETNIANKKLVGRLEYQLQQSKIKLSTAQNENLNHKGKIQTLRREKLMLLQILTDLEKEVSLATRKANHYSKEANLINDKKHKIKVVMAATKQKMVTDMENFSGEIAKAKQNISNTQKNIMNTIREKLEETSFFERSTTANTNRRPFTSNGRTLKSTRPFTAGSSFVWQTNGLETTSKVSNATSNQQNFSPNQSTAVGHNPQEAEFLLQDTEFSTVEELLTSLQRSEDTVFALYNETQSKHEEVEKMEAENKNLEIKVHEQMKRLHELERNQERVKEELEKNIEALQFQITQYDEEYKTNLDLLKELSQPLMILLKNVAVENGVLDQHLLGTGVTDRNIQDFLGLVEQRIDELIQMSKAAQRQGIKREDFLKASTYDKNSLFLHPTPPTITDVEEDDDAAPDDNQKVQPLNIPILKDIMNKKVQKLSMLPVMLPNQGLKRPTLNVGTKNGSILREKSAKSTSSLKSVESEKEE